MPLFHEKPVHTCFKTLFEIVQVVISEGYFLAHCNYCRGWFKSCYFEVEICYTPLWILPQMSVFATLFLKQCIIIIRMNIKYESFVVFLQSRKNLLRIIKSNDPGKNGHGKKNPQTISPQLKSHLGQ